MLPRLDHMARIVQKLYDQLYISQASYSTRSNSFYKPYLHIPYNLHLSQYVWRWPESLRDYYGRMFFFFI